MKDLTLQNYRARGDVGTLPMKSSKTETEETSIFESTTAPPADCSLTFACLNRVLDGLGNTGRESKATAKKKKQNVFSPPSPHKKLKSSHRNCLWFLVPKILSVIPLKNLKDIV